MIPKANPGPGPQGPPRKVNVLLVDDDPDFLHAATRVLKHSPLLRAQVSTAQAAGEALKIIDEALFDIVVADYWMQPDDGAKLLRQVAQKDPHLKRVLITGFDEEALKQRGVGADDADLFVDKNDFITMLDRKLTDLLDRAPSPDFLNRPKRP